MKAIRILILTLLLPWTFLSLTAQNIDQYGIRTGIGLSNLYWDPDNKQGWTGSSWSEDLVGYNIFINASKNLNKYLSVRTELGFIQKGCKTKLIFDNGNETETDEAKTRLNNISLDVETKLQYFDWKVNPYLIFGLRGEYLLNYKVTSNSESMGSVFISIQEKILSGFNKVSLSGLVRIGVEYKNLVYLEVEYNPGISNNMNKDNLIVRSRYYGLTIGMNISRIIKP